MDGTELYQRLLSGSAWVVYVKPDGSGDYSAGTGWIVDGPSRLLITNHHVVSADDEKNPNAVVPDETLRVYFPWNREGRLITDRSEYLKNGTYVRAKIIDSNPTIDLAVLQLESLPNTAKPLPLAARSPEPGSTVHSIGNPGASGGMFVYTSGTVRQIYRGKREYGGGQKVEATIVETQSPANPGDSGGPVVNSRGQVVAICSAGNQKAQLVTIFIDVSELKDYLAVVRPFVRPKSAIDWNNRGVHYIDRDLNDKALSDLTEAVRLDPKLADAYFNRARVFFAKKEIDASLADLDEAQRLGEDTMLAHNLRGLCHAEKKEFEKAVDAYTKAVRLDPDDPVIHVNRAEAYRSSEKYEEALRDLDEAIRLDPDEADHHSRRGFIESARKNYDAAVRDYTKAIQLEPDYADYYYFRAIVHENAENLDSAVNDYAEAVKRTKNQEDLLKWLLELGLLHHKRRDEVASQNAFELLAKLDTEFADKEVPVFHKKKLRITNRTGETLKVYVKFHAQDEEGGWSWSPSPPGQESWATYTFEPGESSILSFKGDSPASDKVRVYALDEAEEKGWITHKDSDLPLGVPERGYRSPSIQEFSYVIGSGRS